MIRGSALLLAVVMLLASGRLLACGWECMDQLAVAAEASCHQDAAASTALNGDPSHACLPEVSEPHVTLAKLATAQAIAAPPLVTALLAAGPLFAATGGRPLPPHFRTASPPAATFSVLRI